MDNKTDLKKLYVGNLPYETTSEALSALFGQAGVVTSATIITDKMTGRSKGFGFIEMASEAEAQKAVEMFHGKEYGERPRPLTVNVARPLVPLAERPPRRDGGGYNNNGGSNW